MPGPTENGHGGVRHRRTVAFVGSLAVLAGLVYIAGPREIVTTVAESDRRALGGAVVAALVGIAVWGISLRVILDVVGTPVSAIRAILLFVATTFVNGITPFGQAGGDPINGLLVAQVVDVEYETGLAAIVSVNALNRGVSVLAGLFGIGYVGTAVVFGRRAVVAVPTLATLLAATIIAIAIGWRFRTPLAGAIATDLTPLARGICRILPGYTPPDRETIERRVRGFVSAIERVVADRRRLAVVLALAGLGHLLVAVSLWLSLYAIGVVAPVPMILIAIPVARIAAIVPTPGGMASVDSLLIGVLVATVGVSPVEASAAALIYRGVSFWLPLLIGGGVTAAVIAGRL